MNNYWVITQDLYHDINPKVKFLNLDFSNSKEVLNYVLENTSIKNNLDILIIKNHKFNKHNFDEFFVKKFKSDILYYTNENIFANNKAIEQINTQIWESLLSYDIIDLPFLGELIKSKIPENNELLFIQIIEIIYNLYDNTQNSSEFYDNWNFIKPISEIIFEYGKYQPNFIQNILFEEFIKVCQINLIFDIESDFSEYEINNQLENIIDHLQYLVELGFLNKIFISEEILKEKFTINFEIPENIVYDVLKSKGLI